MKKRDMVVKQHCFN